MTRPAPSAPAIGASAGRLLREAREKQGLHIAALAAALKVSPQKLELLEADRFDALARRHLHARAGADRLPRPEDRPRAGAAPACRRRRASGSESVGEGLNTPFRERPGALVQSGWPDALSRPVLLAGRPAAGRRDRGVLPAGRADRLRRAARGRHRRRRHDAGRAGHAAGGRRRRRARGERCRAGASARLAGRRRQLGRRRAAPAADRAGGLRAGRGRRRRVRLGERRGRRRCRRASCRGRDPIARDRAVVGRGHRRAAASADLAPAAGRRERRPRRRAAASACGSATRRRPSSSFAASRPTSRAFTRDNVARLELQVATACATTDLLSMPSSNRRTRRRAARARRASRWGARVGHRRRRRAGARAVDDQHRHGRRDRHRDPGQGAGARRLRDGAHHGQHARGRGGGAAHPRAARPHGHRRAADRRLPLQRPPPADRLSRPAPRRCRSTASTRATSARATSTTASSRR